MQGPGDRPRWQRRHQCGGRGTAPHRAALGAAAVLRGACPAAGRSAQCDGHRLPRSCAGTYGSDLWSNEGQTPLAWDALRPLSEAINSAHQDVSPAPFGRGTVQFALEKGVGGTDGVRGATGSLVFGQHGKVPADKRLLILHDRASAAPEVALECGSGYGTAASRGRRGVRAAGSPARAMSATTDQPSAGAVISPRWGRGRGGRPGRR